MKDVFDDIFSTIRIRRNCLNCIKRDTEKCECKNEEMELDWHIFQELTCCVLEQDVK